MECRSTSKRSHPYGSWIHSLNLTGKSWKGLCILFFRTLYTVKWGNFGQWGRTQHSFVFYGWNIETENPLPIICSSNEIRKNLEFSPRSFVRKYLEIRSLLFSEIWQLDRTCIGDKNVPSGFLKKVLISLNPLKMTKKWGFRLFFRLDHRNCVIFGTKVNLGKAYTHWKCFIFLISF